MKYAALALAAAISALAVPAVAQDAAPAAAPAPAAAAAPAAPAPAATVAHMLPASTLVSITPDKEISSKKIEVGQKVSFSVVNDITDNGAVVIPRGSHVEGTISFKTGKAIGGKSGKFEVNFDKVNVRG
jgi:hypothetical protein